MIYKRIDLGNKGTRYMVDNRLVAAKNVPESVKKLLEKQNQIEINEPKTEAKTEPKTDLESRAKDIAESYGYTVDVRVKSLFIPRTGKDVDTLRVEIREDGKTVGQYAVNVNEFSEDHYRKWLDEMSHIELARLRQKTAPLSKEQVAGDARLRVE